MRIIQPQNAEEFNRQVARDISQLKQRLGTIGWFKPYPTAERPDPTGRTGQGIFDTDLGKPIWSNGTDWVDATGTVV